ncbi:unnamed protein product [Gadus morhua 'NCC']
MYIVMDGRWDFAESNMKQIWRWWCLVLLKNFPMPSAEELSGSRKRRREGIKLQDKDLCTKRARVAPTASSSEGSDVGPPTKSTCPLYRFALAPGLNKSVHFFKRRSSKTEPPRNIALKNLSEAFQRENMNRSQQNTTSEVHQTLQDLPGNQTMLADESGGMTETEPTTGRSCAGRVSQ